MLKTTALFNNNSGSFNVPFSALDIPTMIENMKHEHTWKKGELNSVILLKSPVKKVMLTVLHEGTEVLSFQANDSVTFQVLEGKLMLHIKEESITLGKGELLTLDEKIQYSFDSVEETAFLLTLVSENIENRMQQESAGTQY